MLFPEMTVPIIASFILLFIAGVIANKVWERWVQQRAEDPIRITNFLSSIKSLDWSEDKAFDSADRLFEAITLLAEKEIRYYYLSRLKRRRISLVATTASFAFGTLGLICPLIAGAWPEYSKLSQLGYLFFAIAAACFAANELFGGTSGHIRAVTTQYKIELVLERFAVEWMNWRANIALKGLHDVDITFNDGFKLASDFLNSCHEALQAETLEWSIVSLDARSKFQSGLERQGGAGS